MEVEILKVNMYGSISFVFFSENTFSVVILLFARLYFLNFRFSVMIPFFSPNFYSMCRGTDQPSLT